jgi:glycosidase
MSWSADKSGFTSGTPFRNVASNAATQNVAAQAGQSTSLLNWYKQLLTLRNTLPSIASGSYVAPFVSGQVMGFQRHLGNEKVLVMVNYGTSSANVAVQDLPANVKLVARLGLAATTSADPTGRVTLPIGAQSVEVYLLQP